MKRLVAARGKRWPAVAPALLLIACGGADGGSGGAAGSSGSGGSSGGGGSGGDPGPIEVSAECSEVAEAAARAVDALVADLVECSSDADCFLADLPSPSCAPSCGVVIRTDRRAELVDGFAAIEADHCARAVGPCPQVAFSCVQPDPGCNGGRCAYLRGPGPGRCPSGDAPMLPPADECGSSACAADEFCCDTRGEPHFCASPYSSCAADFCPEGDAPPTDAGSGDDDAG